VRDQDFRADTTSNKPPKLVLQEVMRALVHNEVQLSQKVCCRSVWIGLTLKLAEPNWFQNTTFYLREGLNFGWRRSPSCCTARRSGMT
jgi:hypothetical protein